MTRPALHSAARQPIAFFLPSLVGGGAERAIVNLVRGVADRGFVVHLVLAKAAGPYLADVPPAVRVVDLRASRVIGSFLPLVQYLRSTRPAVLISALSHANVVAVWAREAAGVA